MNNKQLIIIVMAIIAAGCIIAGAIMFSNSEVKEVNATVNNTTDEIKNITEDTPVKQESSNAKNNEKSDDDSGRYKVYEDGFIEDTQTGLGAQGTQGEGVSHQWVVENYHPEE